MDRRTEYDNIDKIGNNWEDNSRDSIGIFNKYDKDSREVIAARFLKDARKGEKILDLGCSYGAWCQSLKTMGFSNISGIDISKERLEVAAKRGYSNVVVANGTDIPFPNGYFGTVLCVDVLVHVLQREDWKKIFKETSRILKPEGFFVFSIASKKGNDLNNLIRIPVKLVKEIVGKPEPIADYCTFSTVGEISSLMEESGFEIKEIEGQRFSYPDKLIYFPKFMHFLDRVFGKGPLKEYARVLFFKVKKKS